jgi:hypothetical protein
MSSYHDALTPDKGAADRPRRVLPYPVRRIARRYGLQPATASTIAELIGYSTEAR